MKKLAFLLLLLAGCGPLRAQVVPGSWEAVHVENEAHARHENAFVQAGDKFYLVGGRGIKPVDIYDPQAGAWSQGLATPIELHHFQAVAYQGLIYVLGAFTGGYPFETPASHIYLYDPVQDRWTVGPEIPSHRRRGAAGVAVYGDKIYLVCGIVNGHRSHWVPWLDEFDPATNTWRTLPDAPRARDHFQAAVIGGKLYAAGGRRSGAGETGFSATIPEVDVYDFAAGTWRTLPSPTGDLPTRRAGTTVAVMGRQLLVMGGESETQEMAHAEVEALDVETGTWRALDPLHTGRHGTQAIVNPHGVYIAGGCARRGGSPELTAPERLVWGDTLAAVGLPVQPGALELTAVEALAPGSSRVTVANKGGNQGLILSYALATGTGRVDFPYPFPYVLAPGAGVTLTVSFDAAAEDPGALLVRALAPGGPLEVALERSGDR